MVSRPVRRSYTPSKEWLKLMVNERGPTNDPRGLRLAIVGELFLAVSQWIVGDKTTSLAAVEVMATLALALAAVLTLEQNCSLGKAASEEAGVFPGRPSRRCGPSESWPTSSCSSDSCRRRIQVPEG